MERLIQHGDSSANPRPPETPSQTGKSGSCSSEICLSFGREIGAQVRARMMYAFRVFAAIYGYKVVDGSSNSAAFRCLYGHRAQNPLHLSHSLFIPARYRVRPQQAPTGPLTSFRYADEVLYLAFGIDGTSGNPDWLGEIFEWISSSYETAPVKPDSVGRLSYAETVFAKQRITPRRPHANLLMAWMENALRGIGRQALPRPSSPLSDAEHIVLCCHDIDFYYIDWKSALSRVLKNICISCTVYRSASFFADNWRYLLRLLRGRSVGDYLSPLIESIERLGFRSTFFAVARQGHRRDPDYDLTHIAPLLIAVQKRGFPVALHGSYRSIIEDGSLAEEAQALSHAIGERIFGSRQHWLRFDLCEDLFREIEHAGLIFDSTLGFADKVGFRNGVSFAFPPYDFQKEAPCQFLELPLALMDGSLEATCRLSKEEPQDVANQVLDESMRWSWGGMAILWHDPLESVSVPSEINQVFWNCAKRQHASLERWMSTDQFLECCLSRYQNAGLLESVSPATCPSPS